MKNIEREISIYNDLMLIEAFLQNKNKDFFIKNAFSFSTFFNEVKEYFSNKINPNDKLGSIVNFMAPGIIFRALGMGKLGFLLSTVTSLMGIDFAEMMKTAWNTVLPKIKSESITQSDIDGAVQTVINSQNSNLTESQISGLLDQKENINKLVSNSSLNFDDIYMLSKLAETAKSSIMNGDDINDIKYNLNIVTAKNKNIKSNLILFAGKIISFIISAALAALGINLLSDTVKKMTGYQNAFDGSAPVGSAPKPKLQQSSIVIPKQTIFSINSSYTNNSYNGTNSNWIERYPNTTNGISNMLIEFSKQVYNGLDGLEGIFRSSNDFNKVLRDIENYNISATGDNFVFIPKQFKSKKQLVDHFIDDIADMSNKNIYEENDKNNDHFSKYKSRSLIVT